MPKHVLGAEEFNTDGHWEPERIVAVNDELLLRTGSRWDDWREFELDELSRKDRRHYEAWLKRLILEEFDDSRLFVLKDPRICRMLPLYKKLLRSYRVEPYVLIPFRNPIEVCDSLARRNNMTRAFASLVWLRHVVDAEYASRSLVRTFSDYQNLIADPIATLSRIETDLQAPFPTSVLKARDRLLGQLRTEMQHHAATPIELDASDDVSDWVKSAYAALGRLEKDPNDSQAMETFDRIREGFDEAARVLGAASFGEFSRREEGYLSEHRRLRDAIAAHEKKVAEAQALRTASETEAAALKVRIEDANKRLNRQESELVNFQIKLANANETAAALSAAQKSAAELAARFNDTAARETLLKEQVAQLVERTSELAVLLEQARQDTADARDLLNRKASEFEASISQRTENEARLRAIMDERSEESRAQIEARNDKIQSLARQVEEITATTEALRRDFETQTAQGMQAVQAKQDEVESLRRDLQTQAAHESQALEAKQGEIQKLRRDFDNALSAAARDKERVQASLADATRLLAHHRDLAATWEQRFVESHLAHTQDVQALTSSTSWKVTRPLRGVKRAFSEAGFLSAVVRSAGRGALFAMPIGTHRKRKIADSYHKWRLRNSVAAPALAAPVTPAVRTQDNQTPAMNVSPATADAPVKAAPPAQPATPPLRVPDDGRWNLADFDAGKRRIAAYAAALSRPDETGPLWESDIAPPALVSGPLVSIIVRTYAGRGPMLQIALNSIREQIYRPIEVIVVEDGGHSLRDLVEAMNGEDGLTFRHVEIAKLGRSHAANAGLDAATGAFLSFLDDDDYLLPEHVARLSGQLQSRPELAAAYSAALELGADIDPETRLYSAETKNAVFFVPMASSSQLMDRNFFPIQSIMFRHEVCAPYDRFDPNLDALEDWLFWMRMLTGHKVAGLAEITSAFYVPASKRTHKARMDAHVQAEAHFQIQRRAFYESRRLSDMRPVHQDAQHRRQSAMHRSGLPLQPGYRPEKAADTSPLHRALGGDLAPDLAPRFDKRIAAYTSINLRYLPKALAWARSVKEHNPDWETHILLNDAVPADAGDWPDVDVVYPIGQLGVPHFHSWAYGMRVVELCTATKPFYAKKLLDSGYDYVFYFDPDTHAYSDLNMLVDEFGDDEVLITPHCSEDAFAESEIHYNEMSSLAHGVFNLGFLGLKNTGSGIKVADFWCRRLLRHCADDHGRGLFTDQKWFNMVPVFFDNVKILKHKGCNTASWNIANRPITQEGDVVMAGGVPLVFFHFSGYDKNTPRTMFDTFGRFSETLEHLIDEYDRTNDMFARKFKVWESDWALSCYDSGEKIPDAHREIHRTKYQNQLVYETPFFTGPGSYRDMLAKLGQPAIDKMVAPPGYIKRYF
ncbi:MAG: glycosyltransferase [Hyphomonas sp.]|nr:glycosyltransferase [Hyphomonas sp.]